MALNFSTGLINAVAGGMSWAEALSDGRIYGYAGAKPADADTAPSVVELVTVTVAGGVFTAPVKSQAKIVVSGSTGTLDTVKVGGLSQNLLTAAVAITAGALGTSANNIATSINAKRNVAGITAVSDGVDTVTLSLPFWAGAQGDGLTLATTQTTSTVVINEGSSATFGGAGSPQAGTTAINGMNFLHPPVSGVLTKTDVVWKGLATLAGTLGWFRYVAGGSAATGASTTDLRFDGTFAVSGGDIDIPNLALLVGDPLTISTFTFTVPEA